MFPFARTIACAAVVLLVSGCSPASSYTAITSDSGIALVYEGDVTQPTDEQWFGTYQFSDSGCLELLLEGFDHPYTAALPPGSTLDDDGTLTVGGWVWKSNTPAMFGRVRLEGLDSSDSQLPKQCEGGAEIFAITDVQDVP